MNTADGLSIVPEALGLAVTIAIGTISFFAVLLRLRRQNRTIGLFHPYCDAGGGGERVLFCAVKYLPADWDIVIYTGDAASGEEILERCRLRFGDGSTPLENTGRIRFVHLRTRFLVEASTWQRFTLIGQSLGSIILGLEALLKLSPEVYLDTMGYAFTFPAARFLAGAQVGCYVHYPTISSDMLRKVIERRPSYNNDSRIAESHSISFIKYAYYYLFSIAYGLVGRCSSCTMVNSTWTKNHIDYMWRHDSTLVFPPCLATSALEEKPFPSFHARDRGLMISIGQFRPEKDHKLQLSSLKKYNELARDKTNKVKLVLVGSCRGKEDRDRVEGLKTYAKETLQLVENVDFEFKIDATKEEVDDLYSRALIGVHTMWNEHFGIGVVEMMAAGVVVIAHDSGGPRHDIVRDAKDDARRTGFLAANDLEYAQAMIKILETADEELVRLRERAREHIKQFTEEDFGRRFVEAVQNSSLIPHT